MSIEILENQNTIIIQQGIKGDKGDAGNTFSGTAGDNIVSFKPVKIENGLIYHFDSENVANYGKCIGISKTSASVGASVEIVALGKLTVSATLTVGSEYYANGTSLSLTQGTILSQKLGIAIDTNELFVKIEECLIRN